MKKTLQITSFLLSLTMLFFCCRPSKMDRSKFAEEISSNILSAEMLILEEGGQPKDSIYAVVEQMPNFPGGEVEMMKYIAQNLKFPSIAQEMGIQGRITVRFYLDIDGSVKEPQVIRSLEPSLDSIFVQVIKDMPKWTPGKHHGKPVRVYYTLPILPHFR